MLILLQQWQLIPEKEKKKWYKSLSGVVELLAAVRLRPGKLARLLSSGWLGPG